MPRNGSGTYTLPEAAFVPGTVISSTAVNSDFSDLGTAMTGSLARNGEGGMLAELPLDPDGFSYTNDPNTGMHRTGADAQAIECGGVDIVEIDSTGINVNGVIKSGGVPIYLPVGMVTPYAGAAAPTGWLLCYGQAISRTTYDNLFTAIGTAYGTGDGSTTFNLPDLRGRVAAGKDNMGGSAASRLTSTTMTPDGVTLAAVGGAQTHTLTQAQLSVALGTATSVVTDPGHVHPVETHKDAGGSSNVVLGADNTGTPTRSVAGAATSATTGITVATTITNSLGGNAHNNVQPTIITNYIIYAGV